MVKIMLVEDDNNLREIYQARLQAEGYDIVSAKDGEEALVVAKAEMPDLIISDVMMPKISGFEMLDILRNTDGLKDVKVIMLTALGQSDDQQRADRLGADRYLVKSQVTLEDIVKTTHQLLEGDAPKAPSESARPEPSPEVVPMIAPPASPSQQSPPPEPAVAVDPVTAAPPEPTSSNSSIPPSDTPISAPSMTTTDDAAQSAAQEEAEVEAKIEDFVVGATSEATPPIPTEPIIKAPDTTADTSKNDPVATANPGEPASDPAPTNPTETNDQTMEDAVKTLVDNTADSADPQVNATPADTQHTANNTKINVNSAVVQPTEPLVTGDEVPIDTLPDADTPQGSVPIAHKKIIEPIDSVPKKDIGTLLAVEEAKQASSQPATTPAAVVSDQKEPAAENKLVAGEGSADKPVDPNSIAL